VPSSVVLGDPPNNGCAVHGRRQRLCMHVVRTSPDHMVARIVNLPSPGELPRTCTQRSFTAVCAAPRVALQRKTKLSDCTSLSRSFMSSDVIQQLWCRGRFPRARPFFRTPPGMLASSSSVVSSADSSTSTTVPLAYALQGSHQPCSLSFPNHTLASHGRKYLHNHGRSAEAGPHI
jgi:hypothetical protein